MKKAMLVAAALLAWNALMPGTALGGVPPAAPAGLAADVTAADTVVLRWRDNSANEDGFQVERANDSGFTTDLRRFYAPPNVSDDAGYTDATAMERTVYWYRVFAYNSDGVSMPSNAAKVVTPATMPTISLVRPAPPLARFSAGAPTLLQADARVEASTIEKVEYQLVMDDPEGTFNAHDIFAPQLSLAVPAPRAAGAVPDDTAAPPGLPEGSVFEVEVYGTVTAVDVGAGEWQIGSQPVLVYESAATTFNGSRHPVAGDYVKAVALRTASPGPLVARVIAFMAPGSNGPGPAVIRTAYLFNGRVDAIGPRANPAGLFLGGATWSVGGNPFHIDDVTYPNFPAYIDPGLGIGSDATVRFATVQSTAATAREIFLQQPLALFPPLDTTPAFNHDPAPRGLPHGSWLMYLLRGVITGVDPLTGEWQIGHPALKFYEHAGTLINGRGGDRASQIGSEFLVVARRSIEPGPLIADQIRINLNGPMAAGPVQTQVLYLFNGTVESTGTETWRVSGVDFVVNDPREPAVVDPGTRAGIGVGTQVTVQFRPASEQLPYSDLWAPLALSPSNSLWEAQVDIPADEGAGTGILFLRVTDVRQDSVTIAVNAAVGEASAPDAPPGALTAAVNGPGRVGLVWEDNSSNESGFRIERALETVPAPGPWAEVGTRPAGAEAFTDTTAMAGKTYRYRVLAFNAMGDSDPSDTATVSIPGAAPAAPAAVSPASGAALSTLTPRLSWNASEGAANYDVQVTRSADSRFNGPLVQATGLADTFFDIPAGALTLGTGYIWRVRSGNVAGSSNWARSYAFRITQPSQPKIMATQVTGLTPRLSWVSVTGALSHEVQVSASPRFDQQVAGAEGVTDTFFDVPPGALQGSTRYYWRVRVETGLGVSRWSNTGQFRTPVGPRTPPVPASFPRGIAPSLEPNLQWRVLRNEAASFELQISTSPRFETGTIVLGEAGIVGPPFAPGVTVSYQVAPGTLGPGARYYWRVRGVNEFGASAWAVRSFKTP